MIRFGIVGTGQAAREFMRAASLHPEFHLNAVCSRTSQNADDFAARYGVGRVFTSVRDMAEGGEIDAVYIASPNALHSEHTLAFLTSRIPVLCEKPFACNRTQAEEAIRCARENDVLLLHGIRETLTPRFAAVMEAIPRLGPIRQVVASNCRVTPDYENYKSGIPGGHFLPEHCTGAMIDLGIHHLYQIIRLFGMPGNILANAYMLPDGIDGSGALIAKYGQTVVSVNFSKISEAYGPTEFQGEDASLLLIRNGTSHELRLAHRDGHSETIPYQQIHYAQYYVIAEFIALLNEGKTQSAMNTHAIDLDTLSVIDEYRRQVGLVYPCDAEAQKELGLRPNP